MAGSHLLRSALHYSHRALIPSPSCLAPFISLSLPHVPFHQKIHQKSCRAHVLHCTWGFCYCSCKNCIQQRKRTELLIISQYQGHHCVLFSFPFPPALIKLLHWTLNLNDQLQIPPIPRKQAATGKNLMELLWTFLNTPVIPHLIQSNKAGHLL